MPPAMPSLNPTAALCEPAPPGIVAHILDITTATQRAAAWRVPDAALWLVAVQLDGGPVGVWATNDLTAPGDVWAVNPTAQAATTWPHADVELRIGPGDPMVAIAASCLP